MDDGFYKVRQRRNEKYQVRSTAEQLEGHVYYFISGWDMDKDNTSIYIGETAMIPTDPSYPNDAPAWLASGDLQPAVEAPAKKNPKSVATGPM